MEVVQRLATKEFVFNAWMDHATLTHELIENEIFFFGLWFTSVLE